MTERPVLKYKRKRHRPLEEMAFINSSLAGWQDSAIRDEDNNRAVNVFVN